MSLAAASRCRALQVYQHEGIVVRAVAKCRDTPQDVLRSGCMDEDHPHIMTGTKSGMTSRPRSDVPTLPSGTLTFLFTDIEGSTRLWETQREAMTGALARHDALLAAMHRVARRAYLQDRGRCPVPQAVHREDGARDEDCFNSRHVINGQAAYHPIRPRFQAAPSSRWLHQ